MSVRSEVRKATKAVGKVLSARPAPATEADILDTLKREHDEVKELLAELQKAESGSQRGRLVEKIKAALVPHTKAEEKAVYARVIALRDKDAQTDGHEGYVEHELANKTLARLAAMRGSNSAEHQALAKVLMELVEHHIEEEESNVWNDVRENFSNEDRFEMNVDFLAEKARVRAS
jgi:hemerythrin-like domain-containing protein